MSPRARTYQERREASDARRARRAAIDKPDVVMEAAAAFLAVRSRSVEETRRRLNHLGYPSALCDEVVQRLITMHYLDDMEFARAWVESRDRAKPRGAVALRRELQLKGVSDDIVNEVLEARATASLRDGAHGTIGDVAVDADRAAARRLLERRGRTLERETDPQRRRQKAYALLARNGFAPDVCNEVASGVTSGDASEDA